MDNAYPHRPALEVLRFIAPAEFTARHLEQLQRLEAHAWDRSTAKSWAQDIYTGRSWLWEVEGTDSAIVLLSSSCGPGTPLYLEGLAGDGILSQIRAIHRDLQTIAREYGATDIDTSSARDSAFSALAQQMGFIQVSVNYRFTLEAPDGQQEEDDHAATDVE